MEAEAFEDLEAMDDAPAATAAPHLGTTQFHGEDAIALEADVPDPNLLPGEQEGGGVALGIATQQQDLASPLGEHVGQIGQGETLADATLAVDGDDLSHPSGGVQASGPGDAKAGEGAGPP